MNPINREIVPLNQEITSSESKPLQGVDVIKELEPFLDKEHVFTLEKCREMSLKTLQENFLLKSKEFQELSKQCHYLKNQNDSLGYSKSLSIAEQVVTSLNNLTIVLNEKTDTNLIYSIEKNKLELKELQKNIPVGQSLFLQKDLENLKKISTISENITYISELGEFYEPKVSMWQLTSWFEKLIINNSYSGVCVGYKVSCMYGTPLNRMATLIAFKKEPQEKTMNKLSDTQPYEKIKGILHWFAPTKMLNNFLDKKTEKNEQQIIKHNEKLELEISNNRSQTFTLVKEDLPNMLEKWNFEKEIEIASKDQLISKYNAPLELADEADYILLFHQKKEQN